MDTKLLHTTEGQRTYALVFQKGEEVKAGILGFAADKQIQAAQFTAIGAFSRVMLGYFDRNAKTYKEIPIEEQVEVVSLIGNLTRTDDKPKLHARCGCEIRRHRLRWAPAHSASVAYP